MKRTCGKYTRIACRFHYLREKWVLRGERLGGVLLALVREGEGFSLSPCTLAWRAGEACVRALEGFGEGARELAASWRFPGVGSPPAFGTRPLDPTSRPRLNSLLGNPIIEGDCRPEGGCWFGDGGREQLLWHPSAIVLPRVVGLFVWFEYSDLLMQDPRTCSHIKLCSNSCNSVTASSKTLHPLDALEQDCT